MSNYQEGSGPYPPQGGPPPGPPPGQPGAGYQDTRNYAETSHYPTGGQQQWTDTGGGPGGHGGQGGHGGPSFHVPHVGVKSAFKTTEFWIFVVVSLALLIAAAVTDQAEDGQGFGAEEAWRYVTALGVAYILSRGLTKFGSRDEGRGHDGRRG